jgi:hypothetical protein
MVALLPAELRGGSRSERQVDLFEPAEGTVTPEMFGARGDGVTNDSAAMWALRNAVQARGGGVVHFRPGATYIVGQQNTVGVDNVAHAAATGGASVGSYYLKPHPLLNFLDLPGTLVIRGNGAKLKCAAGLKAGTFNPANGTAYTGRAPAGSTYLAWIASPYLAMVSAIGCAAVDISGLELDGNVKNTTMGGGYDAGGFQVGSIGLLTRNNKSETIENVYSHHHAVDGFVIAGPGDAGATSEGLLGSLGTYRNLRGENNGRQALSLVGGTGLSFESCHFGKTGVDLGATFGKRWGATYTAPGAGLDIEPEVSKVRRVTFQSCSFYQSIGGSMVADQGDARDVLFDLCLFEGSLSWSAWPNKPGFKFKKCTFVGPQVNFYYDASNPLLSPEYEDCLLTNDVKKSSTGTIYASPGPVLLAGSNKGMRFRGCTFEHTQAEDSINGSIVHEMSLESCTFVTKVGKLAVSGRYSGRTRFVEIGTGTFLGAPGYDLAGGPTLIPGGYARSFGFAEDPWEYRNAAGVTTVFPATIDALGNVSGKGGRTAAP